MKMHRDFLDKGRQNELEVEDLLDLVSINDISNKFDLIELKKVLSVNKTSHSIPFDRWIDVIIGYFENGYDWLVLLANRDKEFASFAIGVLEATKTIEGFRAIITILSKCDLNSKTDYFIARLCISSINIIVSFSDRIKFSDDEALRSREYIHNFIKFNKNHNYIEHDVVIAYCSLRKLGNKESVELIKKMPPLLREENVGVNSLVILFINKRITCLPISSDGM